MTSDGSRNLSTGSDQLDGPITKLTVSGFKSLYDKGEIEIRPLTILAGANNSGKSSIMQPLLLMKQTMDAPIDTGALWLDGSNIAFTATDQFFSRSPQGRALRPLEVEIELSSGVRVRQRFERHPKGGAELLEMAVHSRQTDVTLRPSMADPEIRKQLTSGWDVPRGEWRVVRNRCFLSCSLFIGGRLGGIDAVYPETTAVQTRLRGIQHVSTARVPSGRWYSTAAVGAAFPGRFDGYVGAVLSLWNESGNPQLGTLADALEALGLTTKVTARRLDETRVEVLVGRQPTVAGRDPDMVNVMDVGSGMSTVLPILVAPLAAWPGDLVYLEEPEMNLHPRAQTALAEVLARAVRPDVRIVVETHSSLLLLGIQSLVAEGKLDPELVALHWFRRDKRGATRIQAATLDEAGRYGEWPVDFADVELKAESDYLDASFSAMARN